MRKAMRLLSGLLFAGAIVAFATAAGAQDIDWAKVDAAFSRKSAISGDVHRYGFPRTDLTVTLDGVTIKPAFALGGWVAFKPMRAEVMAMGDLVLLETEINPVMSALVARGIEVTAVHNHLLRANPAPFYMHVGGHGDAVALATAVRAALAESGTPLEAPPAPAPLRQSTSTPRNSIRSSASRVNRSAACTNLPCRAAMPSATME
jgi:hypothetical protein